MVGENWPGLGKIEVWDLLALFEMLASGIDALGFDDWEGGFSSVVVLLIM